MDVRYCVVLIAYRNGFRQRPRLVPPLFREEADARRAFQAQHATPSQTKLLIKLNFDESLSYQVLDSSGPHAREETLVANKTILA